MTNHKTLGQLALDAISEAWQVTETRVERLENGFNWWPGSFKVSVTCLQSDEINDETWRISVQTDFLKDVEIGNFEIRKRIGLASSCAPSFAWVYTPAEVSEKFAIEPIDKTLRFVSSAYLNRDNIDWLPNLFSKLAILQPIIAEQQFDPLAKLLGAIPNISSPPNAKSNARTFELSGLGLYLTSQGDSKSHWAGSDEFAKIGEMYGKNDQFYSNGDELGLSLETPMGSSSALIRLLSEPSHPTFRSGLLATAQLPFVDDEQSIIDQCMWLNFLQSVHWTNSPQLGTWHAKEKMTNEFSAAHGIFIPNVLYQKGLATQITHWQIGNAKSAKGLLWADLEDLSMKEVLYQRFHTS
jgi:hypothetical protein